MKDGNLSEDTIQKTEILMNSARRLLITLCLFFFGMIYGKVNAQSGDLIGPVTPEEIITKERIFEIYMKRYQPDDGSVKYLSALEDTVTLYIFFGTWCRESKKYIPGLMKSLQLADSKFIETKYMGTDRQKKVPAELLKMFNIKYIPTVVVLKGDKEIGRIVEKPLQPIEADLVQILKRPMKK